MSAQARTAAAGEAMTVLRADAPATSWLERYPLLRLLIRRAQDTTDPWAGGLHPNLFTSHPSFQLDAKLGYVAALAECLVQSHGGTSRLTADDFIPGRGPGERTNEA